MKKYLFFAISVVCYLLGTGGLFYFLGWLGGLFPWHQSNELEGLNVWLALTMNFSLLVLFGVQHSMMARQQFKDMWTRIVPPFLERSIYVAISGLLCLLMSFYWQPIAGHFWQISPESSLFVVLQIVFFFGVFFLLSSSFLINHFELFGVQQTYFHLVNKKARPPRFVEFAYYRMTRHPIYLGVMLTIWATPEMAMGRLMLAMGLTTYIYIGIYYEEKDLVAKHGSAYLGYQKRVSKLLPGAIYMNSKPKKTWPKYANN